MSTIVFGKKETLEINTSLYWVCPTCNLPELSSHRAFPKVLAMIGQQNKLISSLSSVVSRIRNELLMIKTNSPLNMSDPILNNDDVADPVIDQGSRKDASSGSLSSRSKPTLICREIAASPGSTVQATTAKTQRNDSTSTVSATETTLPEDGHKATPSTSTINNKLKGRKTNSSPQVQLGLLSPEGGSPAIPVGNAGSVEKDWTVVRAKGRKGKHKGIIGSGQVNPSADKMLSLTAGVQRAWIIVRKVRKGTESGVLEDFAMRWDDNRTVGSFLAIYKKR